jgi:xanthine dehydrogenase accessory factor
MTKADPFLERLLASIEAGQAVALVAVVKARGKFEHALGKRALIWLDDAAFSTDWELGLLEAQIVQDARDCLSRRQPQLLAYAEDELEVFVEVQRRPPTLIIVGAGHVALPLAQLGKMIDFEVVVLDDRPLYANQQRFPMADQVLAQPFAETLRQWPIDEDTYLILVTRGHSHDVESLLEVIDSPARYIGMIGSKRRVKAVFELLEREKGIDPARLERVYAPIGLDIGAESPSEIAIGVIAEIINVYRGGRAVSLSDALRADRRLALHPGRSKKAD